MDKAVLRKYINIISFALWLGALVDIIYNNVSNLKATCILLLVYILLDTAQDIWESKDVK
ncbi:hypothetical protein [Clostridium sp.]|uniref:hypothetical protein n=1 Tax=Clostridium sp. TaxID=1506 RepID=UPI00261041AD|nr:hypothetical protein [Clostridium sp.]